MKIKHDKKQKKIFYRWTDYLKNTYVRKQVSTENMTANEIKLKIEELKKFCKEQENWTLKKSEAIKNNEDLTETGETPYFAIQYLEQVEGDNLTRCKNYQDRKRAKNIVNEFCTFLKEKGHEKIYLHQINKKIAREFHEWMKQQKRTFSYKKHRWLRLGYVFNIIMDEFEDSSLGYKNPFATLKLEKIAQEEPIQSKARLTLEEIRELLKFSLVWQKTKIKQARDVEKVQRFCMVYLLALTGIRPKDIVLLKWEQIDFTKRTLTIVHTKTEKKGISTVIFLTPHLLEIFWKMQEWHEKEEPLNKKYVFSFYSDKGTNKKNFEDYLSIAGGQSLVYLFRAFREMKELGTHKVSSGKRYHTHCLYSLRGTVSSILSAEHFNQNAIDYLQGHKPNNTTAKFYLDLAADPKRTTEAMLNHMAYKVIQIPLTKRGLEVAYIDELEEKKRIEEQRQIEHDMKRDKDGSNLLVHTLIDKSDDEKKDAQKKFEELVAIHGEELARFIMEH